MWTYGKSRPNGEGGGADRKSQELETGVARTPASLALLDTQAGATWEAETRLPHHLFVLETPMTRKKKYSRRELQAVCDAFNKLYWKLVDVHAPNGEKWLVAELADADILVCWDAKAEKFKPAGKHKGARP